MDGSCSSCGDMAILESLCFCCDAAFVPAPGDLRVTVRASPRGVPHPSSTLQLVGLLLERAGISAERGTPPVSFNAPPDDQMLIAASEGELSLFQG